MTQPMNDFIPLAFMGMGRVDMALTREARGVIVDVLSLLDNNRHMYFTLDLKVWILLIAKNMHIFST